jgi:hypothetical protein
MTDIDALTGRDLDAAVAVALFGWRWYAFDGGHYSNSMDGGKRGTYKDARVRHFWEPLSEDYLAQSNCNARECTAEDMALPIAYKYSPPIPPAYSSSWDAMRLVVEEMLKLHPGSGWEMYHPHGEQWVASYGKNGARHKSLPTAVARAALKALEKEPC